MPNVKTVEFPCSKGTVNISYFSTPSFSCLFFTSSIFLCRFLLFSKKYYLRFSHFSIDISSTPDICLRFSIVVVILQAIYSFFSFIIMNTPSRDRSRSERKEESGRLETSQINFKSQIKTSRRGKTRQQKTKNRH